MEQLLWLVGLLLLRFVWQFIERAARSGQPDPGKVDEERKAKRERRRARGVPSARREPTPAPRPAPSARSRQQSPAGRRSSERRSAERGEPSTRRDSAPEQQTLAGGLLEQLRRAVEEATGVTSEAPPPPATAPVEHVPPRAPERVAVAEVAGPEPSPVSDSVKVTAVGRSHARARDFRVMLRDPLTIRHALVLREILGPPVALKGRGRP